MTNHPALLHHFLLVTECPDAFSSALVGKDPPQQHLRAWAMVYRNAASFVEERAPPWLGLPSPVMVYRSGGGLARHSPVLPR
jgi:hypothetical protein